MNFTEQRLRELLSPGALSSSSPVKVFVSVRDQTDLAAWDGAPVFTDNASQKEFLKDRMRFPTCDIEFAESGNSCESHVEYADGSHVHF